MGGYTPRYSEDLSLESFLLGLVSLTLTLLNILCIIITGVLILRLKEVTASKVPQKFQHFWRTDVKAHRDYYKATRQKKGLSCRKPLDGVFSPDVYNDNEDDVETDDKISSILYSRSDIRNILMNTYLDEFDVRY